MKRLLLFISPTIFVMCTLLSASGLHKKPADFNEGIVVLHSGDTIRCELKFTRKVSEGLIQVFRNNRVEILTVKDVHAFSFTDKHKNAIRTFYNVTIMPEMSSRKHEVFLELVYGTSKMLILNHRTLGYADNAIQINPFRKKQVVDNQYLLDSRTRVALPLSRQNALAMMSENSKDIVPFIENNSLKFKEVEDFVRLLDFHQSLQ